MAIIRIKFEMGSYFCLMFRFPIGKLNGNIGDCNAPNKIIIQVF